MRFWQLFCWDGKKNKEMYVKYLPRIGPLKVMPRGKRRTVRGLGSALLLELRNSVLDIEQPINLYRARQRS
jgi:hypothetical protein